MFRNCILFFKKTAETVIDLLSVGLAAWFGGAGILLFCFYTITPLSATYTVMVFPLVTMILIFGYFAYIITLILALWGLNRFLGKSTAVLFKHTLYLAGLIIFLGALAGLIYPMDSPPDAEQRTAAIRAGGVVGSAMAWLLLRYVHVFGAYLITITALLVLFAAVTGIHFRRLALGAGVAVVTLFHGLKKFLFHQEFLL